MRGRRSRLLKRQLPQTNWFNNGVIMSWLSVLFRASGGGPQTGQSAAIEKRSALMLLLIKFKTNVSSVINITEFGCHRQWHITLDATQPNEKQRSTMWCITEINPIGEMHFEWDNCNCIWYTSFHPHPSSLAPDDGRCAWLNGGDMTTYKVWLLSEGLQVTFFRVKLCSGLIPFLSGNCKS